MKTTLTEKYSFLRCLTIGLLSAVLFTACSKKDDTSNAPGASNVNKSGADITATFQFNTGKKVDISFYQQKDDLIKSSITGPNENNHYKMMLRGEKTIDDMIYTILIYVTMPEGGVRNYPFGIAWQWHDEGLVSEIHLGVQEKNNLLNLKQYFSRPPNVDNTNSEGVTITSLTTNHVVGTFSGVFGFTESNTITIDNGKFDIDIIRQAYGD